VIFMDYVLIENGKVTKIGLPKIGKLKDGRSVSCYHLLSHEVLLQEGWLPLIDNPPVVVEGFVPIIVGYEIFEDKVEVLYELEQIHEKPEETSVEEKLEKISVLEEQNMVLQQAIIELSIILGNVVGG